MASRLSRSYQYFSGLGVALRISDYRYLLLGNVMMSAGFQVRQMAQAWLVLDQTGSSLRAGIVNGMPGISVLIAVFGGTIADRLDRRMLVRAGQFSVAALMLTAAALVATGAAEWWHLIPIGMGLGITFAFLEPATASYSVDVVGEARLLGATSLSRAVSSLAGMVAPVAGGAALALGVDWAFWMLAAVYCAGFLATLPLKTVGAVAPQARSIAAEMRSGLVYAARTPVIKWLLALGGGFLFNGIAMSVTPIFAREVFDVGEVGYGTMLTVQGAGSLCGAVALMLAGDLKRKGLVIFASMVLAGAFLVVFALSPWYLLALVALFGIGMMQGTTFITVPTTLQKLSQHDMRGRVMGIYVMVVTLFQPAWVLGGWLNTLIGTRQTAVAAGAGMLVLACVAFWRSKELRTVS